MTSLNNLPFSCKILVSRFKGILSLKSLRNVKRNPVTDCIKWNTDIISYMFPISSTHSFTPKFYPSTKIHGVTFREIVILLSVNSICWVLFESLCYYL